MRKVCLIIVLFFCFSANSFACSCIITKELLKVKVRKAYDFSDLIFTGKVIDVKEVVNKKDFLSNYVAYTFQIIENLKGEIKKTTIEIYSYSDEASCGYVFSLGKTYLVFSTNYDIFMTNRDDIFYTGLCTRNKLFNNVKKKELKILRKLNN